MWPKFTAEGTRLEPSFLKHLTHGLSTIKAKNSRPLRFSGGLYLSTCLFLSCPLRPTPQHLRQLYLLQLSLYLSTRQYSSSLYRLWAKKGQSSLLTYGGLATSILWNIQNICSSHDSAISYLLTQKLTLPQDLKKKKKDNSMALLLFPSSSFFERGWWLQTWPPMLQSPGAGEKMLGALEECKARLCWSPFPAWVINKLHSKTNP